MEALVKRFKIVALLIMSDDIYECISDKIEIVADALDSDYPKAEEMVEYLEDSVLKINDYLTSKVS